MAIRASGHWTGRGLAVADQTNKRALYTTFGRLNIHGVSDNAEQLIRGGGQGKRPFVDGKHFMSTGQADQTNAYSSERSCVGQLFVMLSLLRFFGKVTFFRLLQLPFRQGFFEQT